MEAEEAVRRAALDVSLKLGLEIWDVEIRGPKSQPGVIVYADKPGGITLDDLEALSHGLEAHPLIDAAFSGAWRLDVASPGPERRLRQLDDVRRFSGERAQFTLKAAQGSRRRISGRIAAVADEAVVLDGEDGQTHRIPWSDVALAKLSP